MSARRAGRVPQASKIFEARVNVRSMLARVHFETVRISGKSGVPIQHFDSMPLQLILDHGILALDHFRDSEHEIFNLNLSFDTVTAPVE